MNTKLVLDTKVFVAKFLEELSLELIELNIKKHRETLMLNVIADRFEGGITIDQCARLNKKIVHALEDEQWFSGDFTVDVSSPGIDRELKSSRDFQRAVGHKVRIHLNVPVNAKVEHQGEVCDVVNNEVFIQNKDQTIQIPLEHISKAVQVIE